MTVINALTRSIVVARSRHVPAMSAFSRSAFYSTTPSKKSTDPVQPSPASMDDLTGAIKAGTAGSVAPENSITSSTSSTPAVQAPTGWSGKVTEFVRKGKEIVIQCKDGVKLLWVNKKIVKDLKRAQLEDGHQLTRREYQLVCQRVVCSYVCTREPLFRS
jgi:hypothetical protein